MYQSRCVFLIRYYGLQLWEGWIGFRIDGFGLKKRTDCRFVRKIERIREFWKHSGSWISCKFWRGFRIVPVLMFGSWVLNEIWIIDLSSALIGMWTSTPKSFLFSKKEHLNSGVRLELELYCVIGERSLTIGGGRGRVGIISKVRAQKF